MTKAMAACIGIALACTAGCSSRTTVAPPTPVPASTPAPAPTLMDRCPDASDGPSLIAMAIEDTHRALAANTAAKLPPACVLLAFARIPGVVPDSLNEHALVVAAAQERRGTDMRDVLTGEIAIHARAGRLAELARAHDRLVLVDTQAPFDVVRLAAASARARGDSASLRSIMSRAAARSDAPAAVRNENNVLTQTTRLLAAINQARGLIRQNPKYVAGYPSIVANFGTLGQADSVIVYVRRALAQGATRAALAPSVESLASTMLRHASLYASTFDWDGATARAMRVDSAFSSPAIKYLIASLYVQAAGPRIASTDALVNGLSWWPAAQFGAAVTPSTRSDGCARLPAISASLRSADTAMSQGGSTYPGGGAELTAALSNARQAIARLIEVCAR